MRKTSLSFRLIVSLSVLALTIWMISTLVAWRQTKGEVSEVFDAQQVLFAQRLASSDLRHILVEFKHNPFSKPLKPFKRPHFEDDALAFAIFTDQGERLLSDGENGAGFIFKPKAGFHKSHIENDDDLWRIFWLPVANGKLWIAVGQELEYREEVVQKIVLSQMMVWFISLPFLIGLIWWVVRRELVSIVRLRHELLERSPLEDKPLNSHNLPTEIQPLVDSLNGFFSRTAQTLWRERRFTSDAAHELRSPLAALRIQTEVAQIAGDDVAVREQALRNLTLGIDRASQLIEQLLTLSRLDSLQQLEQLEEIDWQALITSLLAELYFNAQRRQMELEFNPFAQPASQGQPLLLSLMLRNLIDNAIRYCPEGSRISVQLHQDRLVVEDNGVGVEEKDLAKLGQRFFRPAGQNEKGSGLGLSIVQRIAELHEYSLHLQNIYQETGEITGLRATLYFTHHSR